MCKNDVTPSNVKETEKLRKLTFCYNILNTFATASTEIRYEALLCRYKSCILFLFSILKNEIKWHEINNEFLKSCYIRLTFMTMIISVPEHEMHCLRIIEWY